MTKYVSGVRREDFIEYADYLRALHESGEPVPEKVQRGAGGGFYGNRLRAIGPGHGKGCVRRQNRRGLRRF
jgi:hypothetical protein